MQYQCWHGRPAYAYSLHFSSPYESRRHGHGHSRRGSDFGVRRPLRYMRYQLDLDESQTRRVAAVLNRLKLEREQGQLDEKRCVAAIADLVAVGSPTQEEVKVALAARVTNAERLQNEVALVVREICEILDDDQREVFSDMLRTGSISI